MHNGKVTHEREFMITRLLDNWTKEPDEINKLNILLLVSVKKKFQQYRPTSQE